MSPMQSNSVTSLDCFANAMKLVVDAARIDPKYADLVPRIAVAYANVVRDPKSKVALPSNVPPSMKSVSDPAPTATTYLFEAISVLSLAGPVFGMHVSKIIPLIIKCMTESEPSGFASTEVGAETRFVTVQQNDNDDKEDIEPIGDVNIEPTEYDEDNDKKLPASRTYSAHDEGTGLSPKEDTNRVSIFCPPQNSSPIGVSDKATIDKHEESDSADTIFSNSSNRGKRLERPIGDRIHVFDRIPKRTKLCLPFKFNSRILTPMDKGTGSYGSLAFRRAEPGGIMLGMSREEKNQAFSMTKSQQNDSISLKELLERYRFWQRNVLLYKPEKKCIPTDTYLVIVITCNGPSDAPYFLNKFEHHDEVKDTKFKEFLSIKKIIMIPRPLSDAYMYYLIPNLHKWLHGSLHLGTEQEHYFNIATKHIEDIVFIQPGQRYEDRDLGIKVKYEDRFEQQRNQVPPLRELIPYVGHVMDPSTASAREVPCLSSGWSTSNPTEYKRNRINILGSIRPSLSGSGIYSLEQRDRDTIIDLVCHVIRVMSPSGNHPHAFFHSDPNIMEMREELARAFLHKLGFTSRSSEEKYFRAEGISLMFNNFVPFHVDALNDTPVGYNETLAMNCQCIIGYELARIPSIKKAMSMYKLSVGDPLSFSMVLYSRKVVGDFVKKQLRTKVIKDAEHFGNSPNLPECWWLLKPLLNAIENVNADVNTNAIWDNYKLTDDYLNSVQCEPHNLQYCGDYISLIAGYDKMRHWSPIKYLVDALHARDVIKMNRDNIMGFICFAAIETNGTFLLSGILDEILSSPTSSATRTFMSEYNAYGLYAALIFAAERINKEADLGSAYAFSQKGRFKYNNRGTTDGFPIAGGPGLHSFQQSEKYNIRERCIYIIESLADECFNLHATILELSPKNKKENVDGIARSFLEKIQEIGGQGVSHRYALNFIELASIFGFIPFDIIQWACVGPKTSCAFKAINDFYNKSLVKQGKECRDLTEEEAEKHFKAAVKYVSTNVNWNFSACLAESILCQLHQEVVLKAGVPCHDIIYIYRHRGKVMNHLYRWKLDTNNKAILQVLLMNKNCRDNDTHSLLEIGRDGCREGNPSYASFWKEGSSPVCVGVSKKAEYVLSRKYKEYFA